MIVRGIRSLLFAALRIKPVNALVRALVRPMVPVLPDRVVDRVPLVGTTRVRFGNSNELILTSDGSDRTASRLGWRGLDGHEPETMRLFVQLLRHADVVLDVGAYVGLFALVAAVDRNDREVHAFEPVPRIFDRLVKNIEANDLRNLTPVRAAVTNHDGEVPLYVPRRLRLSGESSTQMDSPEMTDTIVVPAVSLDSYVRSRKIAKVDLIKMDTEATEPDVLRGSRMILERDEPTIICEVLPCSTAASLQRIFDNTDYQFFHITHSGLIPRSKIIGDEPMQERNYLFITSTRSAQIGDFESWVADLS